MRSEGDEPVRPLLVLGVLTAVLGAFGSLDAISSFASLTFITLFGGISFLAFQRRVETLFSSLVPAVGVIGAVASIAGLVYHLITTEPLVFVTVLVLVIAVLSVEVLYFERDPILAEVEDIEKVV